MRRKAGRTVNAFRTNVQTLDGFASESFNRA